MNLSYLRINDMANLFSSSTGVDKIIWVSTETPGHKIRLKVGKRGEEASVSVEDNPEILAGSLDSKTFKQISSWIKVNKDVLIKYWKGEIDTWGLVNQLKKLN